MVCLKRLCCKLKLTFYLILSMFSENSLESNSWKPNIHTQAYIYENLLFESYFEISLEKVMKFDAFSVNIMNHVILLTQVKYEL